MAADEEEAGWDADTREEVVVIVAGLAGVVVGQMLKGHRRTDMTPETARFTAIGASTVVATPRLARLAGDAVGLDRQNLAAQVGLAFLIGAILTFFAEEIGRYLPGAVRPNKQLAE